MKMFWSQEEVIMCKRNIVPRRNTYMKERGSARNTHILFSFWKSAGRAKPWMKRFWRIR